MVGDTSVLRCTIGADEVGQFAQQSGDDNPLHLQDDFAQSHGLKRRVVHGAWLLALVSRLVGTRCPGPGALIHAVNMRFLAPVYVDDTVRIESVIAQISAAVRTIVLKVVITNDATQQVCAQGTVQVGLLFPGKPDAGH